MSRCVFHELSLPEEEEKEEEEEEERQREGGRERALLGTIDNGGFRERRF